MITIIMINALFVVYLVIWLKRIEKKLSKLHIEPKITIIKTEREECKLYDLKDFTYPERWYKEKFEAKKAKKTNINTLTGNSTPSPSAKNKKFRKLA